MGISKYLKIGLRWWWLILLCVGLSAIASNIYSQRLPKIYAARTTLVVGANITQSRNPNPGELELSRTLAEIYATLVHRAPITRAVIDRLGLDMTPDELSEMIQTSVIPQAQLLEIFVLDVHPQRAQLLANTLAEELILQSPTGAGRQQERDQFVEAQLNDLQIKIQETDARIKELEDKLPSLTSAVEIAEAQSQLSQLNELKTNYQSNYNQFLANLSESSTNRLAIFEPATEPTWPISPNIRNNVLIAAAAGLALAITAIIVLEFFDDTLVWRKDEDQYILDLPVLGAVKKVSNRTGQLIIQDRQWSPEANALRNLRSSLFLAASGRKLTTLLITSTAPGEGKTFLAANLAAMFASPGASVASVIASPGAHMVLIDADLLKPALHEIFDMPNLIGLADVLAAPESATEAMLKRALRRTGLDNLLLLPAGRTPLDSGYLLNSPRFRKILDLLAVEADLIIIDSAPILDSVETKAVANMVDGVMLVIRDGLTRKKAVQKIEEYFHTRQLDNLLGIVFNRVKMPYSYGEYGAEVYPRLLPQAEKAEVQSSFLARLWPFGRGPQTRPTHLSLAETASYLGVSEDTARRWCEEGRFPATQDGRSWTVRLEDLNEFIVTYQHADAGHELYWETPALITEDYASVQRITDLAKTGGSQSETNPS